MIKKCECCFKEFKTYKSTQRFCGKTCGQCDKRQGRITKECIFTGCSNSFKVLSASTKSFCSRECQINWQRYSQIGENNGNFGRKNSWGCHSVETKLEIKEKVLKSWQKEERLIKHNLGREKYRLINGYYPTFSPIAREKISEANIRRMLIDGHLTTFKNCKRGYYYNKKLKDYEYYHSSWEEKRMKELDEDDRILYWTKKHNFIIKYKHNGINKSYLPDFFIEYIDGEKILEEVKGYVDNIKIFLLKKESAIRFCLENDFTFKINFMENERKYKHLL